MDGMTALQKLKILLKSNAHWEGKERGAPHWEAMLCPIDLDLSGEFPVDELNAALSHVKEEKLVERIVISDGEVHDDDDLYFVHISDAGALWLDLPHEKSH